MVLQGSTDGPHDRDADLPARARPPPICTHQREGNCVMTQIENACQRALVYRHNVAAPVPAWLYRAFLIATRKAPADRIPIVMVEDEPHPFICIEVDDFNELLAATANQREDSIA